MGIILWRRPLSPANKKTVTAIGNFDGIHLGHQAILHAVMQAAQTKNLLSCLLTFEPHPQTILYTEKSLPRLTSLREKIYLLEQMGIEQVYLLPFDQKLANFTAQQFIDEILIKQLRTQIVVVGENFRFGKQRQGDVQLLQSVKQINTLVIPPVSINDQRVSSTFLRKTLAEGNLSLAENLLKRPYRMIGRVVRGNQRGKQLGYPTANIALHQRLPALWGVFAIYAYLGNRKIAGVANIGKRPTVDGVRTFLEVYLFDFNQDIYGRLLWVEFIVKLRDEKRFASVEELKKQIGEDVKDAKRILARLGE